MATVARAPLEPVPKLLTTTTTTGKDDEQASKFFAMLDKLPGADDGPLGGSVETLRANLDTFVVSAPARNVQPPKVEAPKANLVAPGQTYSREDVYGSSFSFYMPAQRRLVVRPAVPARRESRGRPIRRHVRSTRPRVALSGEPSGSDPPRRGGNPDLDLLHGGGLR